MMLILDLTHFFAEYKIAMIRFLTHAVSLCERSAKTFNRVREKHCLSEINEQQL